MSDKGFSQLNEIDQRLRRLMGSPGPNNEGTQLVIEKICGFEYFNTRAYHNYETWGDGYRISIPSIVLQYGSEERRFELPLSVEAEDLDDAVAKLEKAYSTWKEHPDWSGYDIMKGS